MRRVLAFAPGRTELAGNHTDHQGGRVIAAAVDCGVEVELQRGEGGRALLDSEGFDMVDISIAGAGPREGERFTTASLVRGVVDGVRAAGVEVSGFSARAASTVAAGSGLSSSAAFELALAAGLCALFGEARADGPYALDAVSLAKIGQVSERDYFGKPCGLMDQLAVAHGSVVSVDFSDMATPSICQLDFDFEASGYTLCLIDTHCDHSAYTDEYAQVATDMNEVAQFLGAAVLSQVPERDFLGRFEEVRASLGDACALRALHYYHENRLVDLRARALEQADMEAFLDLTRRSGASSAQYLQNVSTGDRERQPAMVALALADALLGAQGACRIHGGGFGGTVLAFVPTGRYERFAHDIDAHLGKGSCKSYRISERGAHAQWI